jgi:hypothetical protein
VGCAATFGADIVAAAATSAAQAKSREAIDVMVMRSTVKGSDRSQLALGRGQDAASRQSRPHPVVMGHRL